MRAALPAARMGEALGGAWQALVARLHPRAPLAKPRHVSKQRRLSALALDQGILSPSSGGTAARAELELGSERALGRRASRVRPVRLRDRDLLHAGRHASRDTSWLSAL